MRALAAFLIVVALALAGCTDGGDKTPSPSTSSSTSSTSKTTSSSSTTSSSTSSSSTSSSSGPAPNRAPVGSLAAATNGTTATFTLTGSDPDGDALSWVLAFGDGAQDTGSALPANVTHEFAVGNYTATFNVTDGKLTASYTASVAIAAAGAALTFTGDVSTYCAFCTEVLGEQDGSEPASPFPSISWQRGEQGIDAVWVVVPAELAGRTWTATTTGVDIATAAFTACGPTGKFLEMVDTGAVPETGLIPAGTGCFVLWEYLSWVPPPIGAPSDPTAGEQTLSLVIA